MRVMLIECIENVRCAFAKCVSHMKMKRQASCSVWRVCLALGTLQEHDLVMAMHVVQTSVDVLGSNELQ